MGSGSSKKPTNMLIETEHTKKIDEQIKKAEEMGTERERNEQQDSNLSAELREMNRRSDSARRSGSMNRIRIFNKNYADKITKLSKLRQTTGTMDRDEAAEIVREWKQNK